MQAGEAPDSRVHWAIRYFRSGWAFLVPYTAAYFAYAWLRWPVNPAAGGVGAGSMERGAGIPCLLHVYWFLHAIHVALGAVALVAWWKKEQGAGRKEPAGPQSASGLPPHVSRALVSALPWLGLALLFWIPGVYLEFPADPWQHFARLNEWSWHSLITKHSTWEKSGYFLAYSFLGRVGPPALQLKGFDLYYTACCLLLSWQYFRLGRVVGLGRRGSLLFVLVNALVAGNGMFGFHRYYGMSTTILAQIGAVALARVAVELFRTDPGSRVPDPAVRPPLFPSWRTNVPAALSAAVGLLALIAGNHQQGLGIATIGVAAALVWRLIAWHRAMLGWLALAALVFSVATIYWYPRNPLIDSHYRPGGWLTAWYGFNFFDPTSAGFERAWLIFGFAGGANLLAGAWLLRRNQLAAWLTLMPIILLSLPCVAIPFANTLAKATDWEEGYIMAFHRMLFATPAGLALVFALKEWLSSRTTAQLPDGSRPSPAIARRGIFAVTVAALAALTVLPADGISFNRLFNSLMIPAADLTMEPVIDSPLVAELDANRRMTPGTDPALAALSRGQVLATPGIAYVLNATGATQIRGARKRITWPVVSMAVTFAERVRKALPTLGRMPLHRAEFPASTLFSPQSQTAALSGHWLPTEVAQEFSTQAELFAPIAVIEQLPQIWIQWTSPRDHVEIFAKGAGRDLATRPVDDRGRLDSGKDNQVIRVNDTVIFKPVMRTFNNGGLRLVLTITGPGLSVTHPLERTPVPLGGVQWIHNDYPVTLNAPGRYDIEITGTSLWPTATATVRYHFIVQP